MGTIYEDAIVTVEKLKAKLKYAPDICGHCGRAHQRTSVREARDTLFMTTCATPECGACAEHKIALNGVLSNL